MKTIFIFIDEVGAYQKRMSKKSVIAHPYFIKSSFFISAQNWRKARDEFIDLKKSFNIDEHKEVKWSYIWSLNKKRANKERIRVKDKFYHLRNHTEDELKEFIEGALKIVKKHRSSKYLFTVTKNEKENPHSELKLHKMHIQEIMQRVQYEMQDNDDLGIIFADEVNSGTDAMKRELYYDLLHNDGFVSKYKNLKDGLSIDISDHSFGVQIADYAAGAFSSFLRGYAWGSKMFEDYIYPKLRTNNTNKVLGYGIREVPSNSTFRSEISCKLDQI